MKAKSILFILLVSAVLLAACGNNDKDGDGKATPSAGAPTNGASDNSPTNGADVVSTASIVATEEEFIKAISSNGNWIVCLTDDMTVNQDIALEGEFKNGKKDDAGNDQIQRKLALYTQDANRNITNRFTLTAPKFTIKSPNASIQHGSFKGDLYVDVANFQLVDATVDGNIYFTSQEFKDSFTMDETSSVTGTQSVQTQ